MLTGRPHVLRRSVRLDAGARARALGRSVAISVPRGRDKFDPAMTDFAARYADQNERDFFERSLAAIKSGRLEAAEGV